MKVLDRLYAIRQEKGAGFIVLIDPDRLSIEDVGDFCASCEAAGADALFVGSSILFNGLLDPFVRAAKESTTLPVIGFPGSINQVSSELDAVLFLSIISGRNPEYLIGQHVHAAPIVRSKGIEPLATGYMLVESGRTTAAQYMSNSTPLPRSKPDVAAATALAAEMLGMRLVFADGGSGADAPVPTELVRAIGDVCTIPLIVGGGIRSPEQAAERVAAGASFIVIGNAIERRKERAYLEELAHSIHVAEPRPV